MRYYFLLPCFLISIAFTSCNNLVFDKPQPVGGKTVTNIDAFSGTYLSPDNDTLRITEKSISLSNSQRNVITAELGTSMEVRECSNGYVINLPDSVNGQRVWAAYVFKFYNDTLWISFSDFGSEKLKTIEEQVKNIAPYEVIKNEKEDYQRLLLKPKNSNQFEQLVNAGIFNKTLPFRLDKQK